MRRNSPLRPYLAQPLGAGVSGLESRVEVGTEQLELRHAVAGAEPEFQAAVAEYVHHCRLFRNLDRRAQRRQQHRSSDAYSSGACRHRCQKGQRLRQIAIFEQVVFGDPDRGSSEPFRLFAHFEGRTIQLRAVRRPFRRIAQVEIESYIHGRLTRRCQNLIRSLWDDTFNPRPSKDRACRSVIWKLTAATRE
jgi:hypothetical protein